MTKKKSWRPSPNATFAVGVTTIVAIIAAHSIWQWSNEKSRRADFTAAGKQLLDSGASEVQIGDKAYKAVATKCIVISSDGIRHSGNQYLVCEGRTAIRLSID